MGTTDTRSETQGVLVLKGSARGLIHQGTSPRTHRGPRQRSGAGDLDALLEGRAGGRGHWAPGTHRLEAGPLAGPHAAAGHEQRGQAAGPAAAPAPQQQAAVCHGRPRAPLGPEVLRRRGSSAGGRTATGGFSQPRRLGVGQLSPRAAHRRAHGFDARFPDPGVLTSAARRALEPKAAASLRSVLSQSGLEAGPESSSVEGERRAVRGAEGRRKEDQWGRG